MKLMLFLLASAAVMLAISLIERRRNPGSTDWLRNLQAWALNIGTAVALLRLFPDWNGNSLFNAQTMPLWLALPLFLLVRDFTEFLYHYAQHRIPALWAMHSLHHSDPEMTALTTNRHFWGDQFIKALTIWPAATMIIAPTDTIVAAYIVIGLYNYFIHANLKVDFGRWSWVLNCPAYHRRHHSRLPEHYDTNFAALFPIFDVIFGTYRRPDGCPPCGLDEAPRSVGDLFFWPMRKALGKLPSDAPEQPAPAPVIQEA